MKYLSIPTGAMKSFYDVVVIGSGYGGGIAASRLSRAGKKVCVLERGKELQPGEYPNTLMEATDHMQIHTADSDHGSRTGLFDLHVHKGISVLVGCGLGGTSLINANVSIKPEERVFEDPRWPKQLREEFSDSNSLLNKGYALAKDMLKAAPLPASIQLNKLKGLEKAAKANGEKFYRTDINVNFGIDGENEYGIEQKPCNLCGDCCSGCNYSAKNTTLMNYLPDAKAFGAEIFTQTSVSHIEKKGDKWVIHFSQVNTGSEKFNAPDLFVEANVVVLSAGTLGSTEILLRSKEKGLQVSDKTGHEFSGNGDVLGFAYNTDEEIDGLGSGTHKIEKENLAGPCITGVIDHRYQKNLNDGMIVEDAAIPGCLAAILPEALALDDTLLGKNEEDATDTGIINSLKHKARIVDSIVRGAYHGAIKNTQTYLLMTHDGEHGKFQLNNNRLNIDWTNVGKETIFQKADAQLRKETKGLSGIYIKNPVWVKEMNNELVTVHPLGGCYMGENISTSVVNHKGQVFSKDSASGVFENFYVTDGSVMPRSLGVNPLLTISAISERCCAIMAQDNGWTIDYVSTKKVPPTEDNKKIGVEFTETMRGFFTKGISNNDYQSGFDQGKTANQSIQFTLTIGSDDVYEMIKNPAHLGYMNGTVTAPGLSALPLNVSHGEFGLFVDDPNSVNTKLMNYAMRLNSEDGKQFYFKGFKYVHHDRGLDEWPDTSTLYITIFEGHDDKGKIIGQGILHILMADFAKQMKTMKALNAPNMIESLKALSAFGKYFTKALYEVYGGIAAPDNYFNPTAPPRKKRDLRTSTPEYYPFTTADNIQLLLTRYNGGSKGPLMMVHPFNGNRLTFSIDTIDTNLTEYFYQQGYDVWLLDNRLSSLMPSSNQQHTLDSIAKYDYSAAIEKIQNVSGAKEVDVLAHCVGSITMFMSLMQGLKGVRSMISTQIASDFYASNQVKLKAGMHLPQVLDDLGIKSLNAYVNAEEDWENKLYDKFVKLYSNEVAGFCTDPVCQRMTFMFGPLYEHSNMNDATHMANVEMWGNANITSFEQVTKMIRAKKLLDADGGDVYMNQLDRLAIPITFIHGEKNQVFDPKSTLTTYDNLCEANGKELYARFVIPNYGHNDCLYGKNASVDVYPTLLKHFDRFNK